MWSPPLITSDNLRVLLRDAPEGAEIGVPPGEYEGPFILDRPLRLRGLGEHATAATLWSHRGPAVVVRSVGVSLVNLNIELTLPEMRQSQAAVWYEAGCQPQIQNAQIQGRVELMGTSQNGSGWYLPDLIDMGDLRAGYEVSLPMVIRVPAPARLHTELADLYVQPTVLPTAGEYTIQVYIPNKVLANETMLAGQLVIESGSDVRSVWIIGRVVESAFKEWIKDKLILVGQNGRRYGLGKAMVLGKDQLRSERGADALGEKQAYIFKEKSGVWSFIQPHVTKTSAVVNKVPVGVGRRRLLKGGEVIELGNVKLTVEGNRTDLPLAVADAVDFGKLSVYRATHPPAIQIKNHGKDKRWEGTLRSTVPWIVVPQPQVTCLSGQTVQVPVQLGSGLHTLPRQELHYASALMLEGTRESWTISVHLNVDIEERLEVEPALLNFGRVIDPAQIAPQRLRVRNAGTVDWEGTVQVAVPWLAVDRLALQCAAGGETELNVRLTDTVTALTEGQTVEATAITIEGKGLRTAVPAQLDYERPKVQLAVQPQRLDWGSVLDWRAAQPQTIQLRNSGTKAWQGRVESTVPWLAVSPVDLKCGPKGQTTVTVTLTEQLRNLGLGEQIAAGAVKVQGEGLAFPVAARLVVEAPPIQVDTTRLDFVLEDRSRLPHGTLRLHNPGVQAWQGEVKSTLPWLKVQPTDVKCPPGGEAVIDVSLDPQAATVFKKPRVVTVPDAVQIGSGAHPLNVAVHLVVKPEVTLPPPPPPPDKKPDPEVPVGPTPTPTPAERIVDFGIVSSWSPPLPSREIRLRNHEKEVVSGTVRSTLPWVAVTPTQFSCPPGQEWLLTVRLRRTAAQLKPKLYDVADALVVESNGKQQPIGVRLEVAKKVISETLLPLPVNFGQLRVGSDGLLPSESPTREIRVRNSESKVMEGTVRTTAPWLSVVPARFTCAPTSEVVLTARLNDEARRLSPKVYDVADAVVIESGVKKLQVRAQVEILPPHPASELVVDFGTLVNGQSPLPAREIRLSNGQTKTLNGMARSTVRWLQVSPTMFTFAPEQDVTLTLQLTKEAISLRPKIYDVEDAIIIENGDSKQLVRVRLTVVRSLSQGEKVFSIDKTKAPSPPSEPEGEPIALPVEERKKPRAETFVVTPRSLAFSPAHHWHRTQPFPMCEVELKNDLKAEWRGVAKSTVPWLQIEPTEIVCPSGSTVIIKAQLTLFASHLRPRTYVVSDALIIEGGGQRIEVEARLTIH